MLGCGSILNRKRYRFEVTVGLEELTSVPFVNGVIFAKLRLVNVRHSSQYSSRENIHNHRVRWNSRHNFLCKMSPNPFNDTLESFELRISIRKETKGGKSHLKIGFVTINLACFASESIEQPLKRRYILDGYTNTKRQDNSLLQLNFSMKQVMGDKSFKTPEEDLSRCIPYDVDSSLRLSSVPSSLEMTILNDEFLTIQSRHVFADLPVIHDTLDRSINSVGLAESISNYDRDSQMELQPADLKDEDVIRDRPGTISLLDSITLDASTPSRHSGSMGPIDVGMAVNYLQTQRNGTSEQRLLTCSRCENHRAIMSAGYPHIPCTSKSHSRHSSIDCTTGQSSKYSSSSTSIDRSLERKREWMILGDHSVNKQTQLDATRIDNDQIVNDILSSYIVVETTKSDKKVAELVQIFRSEVSPTHTLMSISDSRSANISSSLS